MTLHTSMLPWIILKFMPNFRKKPEPDFFLIKYVNDLAACNVIREFAKAACMNEGVLT